MADLDSPVAAVTSPLRELSRTLGLDTRKQKTEQDRPFVLIVDDDADVRLALQTSFKEQYGTLLAKDGPEAVRAMTCDVAVVILDIKMSDYDGFWVFRTIRKSYPYVPIIFYSAYQDLKNPYSVMNDYRPFAYVTKGAGIDNLIEQVTLAVKYWFDVVHHSTVTRRLISRVLDEVRHKTQAPCAWFVVQDATGWRVEAGLAPTEGHKEAPTALALAGAVPTASQWLQQAATDAALVVGQHDLTAILACPVRRQGTLMGLIYLQRPASRPFSAAHVTLVSRVADEIAITVESTSIYVRNLKSELREQALRQQSLRARLQALLARTNPHFLCNSLSTIANLVVEDPRRAETMLVELARVFRHVVDGSRRRSVPLAAELQVIRDYLGIEEIRLGSRLRFTLSIDDTALPVHIPPLILLHLVENAVLHGIATRTDGGWVGVAARLHANHLILIVEDDGPGLGNSTHVGTRSSWKDLKSRLRLLYGQRAKLTRRNSKRGGLRTVIKLEVRA